MTQDNGLAVQTKTCTQCGREQPIDEFRFQHREKGARHPQCNTCFAAYHRQRTAKNRKRDLKRQVDTLATDPGNPASFGVATRSEAVVKSMLVRFGGLERFADDWFKFLKLAHLAGKHHIVQRSFEAMLKLLNLVDVNHENRQKSLDAMTEGELKSFVNELLIERIWGNPEVAVVVLERLGWELKPPTEEVSRKELGTVVRDIQQRLIGLLKIPSGPSPAAELLIESDDDETDEDDEGEWGDEHEFALFAAQESGESGGLSF